MKRLVIALAGFVLFGVLFAAAYAEPREVERELPAPKFRLAPGEMAPDYIEPGAAGEPVHVNVTVLSGGPIDVYVMNMENLTLRALNGSIYGFEVDDEVTTDPRYTQRNVTDRYNFTLVTDGENRTALLIASRAPPGENTTDDRPVTEVSVTMRYTVRETRSLLIGALLATPSVALVAYVVWRRARKGPEEEPAPDTSRDRPRRREP